MAEAGHPRIRKAFFFVVFLVILAVFGKVAVEAFSFVYSAASGEIPGEVYTIHGESCDFDENAADCCEDVCIQWCGLKDRNLIRAAVVDSTAVKCGCKCSA